MAGQIDKLRAGLTPKPLYIKKVQYVGIRKLVERPNPYEVTTMETYFPYKGEGDSHSLADSLRRTATRRKTIKIDLPATHEIHLARGTVTDSIGVIGDYQMEVAALVNVYGSTRSLLNDRQSGSGVYILGDGDAESVYFVLTWKQVLPVPDYRKKGNSQAIRDRHRYPTENFARIEDGAKVYYLQKAAPEEFVAVMKALEVVRSKK